MRSLKIGAALVILLIAAVAALPFLLDANQFRPLLETALSSALGREVKLGSLKLEIFQGKVSASDVVIAEDPAFGSAPFLSAKSLQASVELRPLILERNLVVTGITVGQPELRVVLSPTGQWNFSTLGKTSSPSSGSSQSLAIQQVTIQSGQFTLVRPAVKEQPFRDIDLELSNLSGTTPIAFKLSAKRAGGGSIDAEGSAGPLSSGTAALPPLNATFKMAALDLVGAGLVDKSAGVGGVVGFSGQVRTKENILDLSGNLRAEKLKLVPEGSMVAHPVDVAFAIAHDLAKGSGRLTRADVRVGKASSTLTGTYNTGGKATSFNLKLNGPRMLLTELAGLLPALNIALPAASTLQGGTLSLETTVSGTAGYFSAMGPVKLENVKLANFDLGKSMRVIQLLAGLPNTPTTEIPLASAAIKHTPEGTLVDNLTMTATSIGTLTGAGTIDARNQLDFRLRATLKTSGELMRSLGQKGDTTVPFLISGTTDKPIFKADVKALTTEKLQQLTKDPVKTINKAKELFEGDGQGIFNLFRRKSAEPSK